MQTKDGENSCIKTSRSCSAYGKDGHWVNNKGGWHDPELCAKARREEVEYIRRHKMYVRVPREVCLHETGKAPSQGRVGGDRQGTAQGSLMCARDGLRRKDTRQTSSCMRRHRRWKR